MATPMYFYLEGIAGCDACSSTAGYYIDTPSRSHPNCDCVIHRKPVFGDFQTVYRNPRCEDGGVIKQSFPEDAPWMNSLPEKALGQHIREVSLRGSFDVPEEIEQYFLVSRQYREESMKTISHTSRVYELAVGEGIYINIFAKLRRKHFSIERWFLFPGEDGETEEIFDSILTGEITVIEEWWAEEHLR